MIAVQLCLGLIFFVLEHQCRVVIPHENCTNNVCYFDFVVDYKFTMMWYNYTNPREPQFQPVVIRDGILQRRVTNVACREQYIPLTREGTINDYSRVINFSKVCKNLNVASFFFATKPSSTNNPNFDCENKSWQTSVYLVNRKINLSHIKVESVYIFVY